MEVVVAVVVEGVMEEEVAVEVIELNSPVTPILAEEAMDGFEASAAVHVVAVVAASPREVVVEKGAKVDDDYLPPLESIHPCVHTPHCNTAAAAVD